MTFGLGSGVAGMAGVALSQIDNVSPNLGQGYIIDSFMVVVFGGVGNLWGTVVSALTLGVVGKFLEPLAGAVLGKIVVLVLLIAFIQRKPRGLFPLQAGGRWRHEPRPRWRSVSCWCWGARRRWRYGNLAIPDGSRRGTCRPTPSSLVGQISLLRDAGAGGRPGVGVRRHTEPRPCRVLRARRLRDGHVPDAPDRPARRVRQPGAAGLHGVPEL